MKTIKYLKVVFTIITAASCKNEKQTPKVEDAAATETETKGVDDSYNEELGLKLFDGWVLTKLNCPGCNLPLISEYEGAPSVCLRCE